MAARICREAGGRVRTNMFVRVIDLDVPVSDGRRLEVVVDGPVGSDSTAVLFVLSMHACMALSRSVQKVEKIPTFGQQKGTQELDRK